MYSQNTQAYKNGEYLPYGSTFRRERYGCEVDKTGTPADSSEFVDVDVIDAGAQYSSRTLMARGPESRAVSISTRKRGGCM